MTNVSLLAARPHMIAMAVLGLITLGACGGGGDGPTQPPAVTSVSVTPATLALFSGTTGSVTATVAPSGANGAVTWTSESPAIATVSGSGTSATITGVSGGTAIIRATSSSFAAISGTVSVTVTVPVVASLTLSTNALTLVPAQPVTLVTTARDAAGATISGAPITWTSSDAAVAGVGADGRVTGIAPGSAVITARSGDATATAAVTVDDGGYVTSAGGSISALGGAVVLDVPPGGVTTGTAFTVRQSTTPPDHARLLANTAIVVESSSPFTSTTRLHIAYPAVLAPDVVETQLRLARETNGTWSETAVETVNRTARLVSAPLTTAGTWAVFAPPPTLRSFSQLRGIDIGGEVNIQELRADTDIRRLLGSEFNTLTAGNTMKFDALHPSATTYTFTQADEILAFAEANGMRMHGHVLLWHMQNPAWITAGGHTRETLMAALKGHIETVLGRWKGRIPTWDVANEVISVDQTGLRPTFWVNIGGPDIIDSAFVWARRTDPSAKLYLNDFAVEGVNAKSDSMLAFATRLKARGVPIDGLGLQAHYTLNSPTLASMKANFDRIAAAGFDIRITELDVRLPDGTDNLAAQATIYANTMEACRAQPRCKAVTTWGVSDKYSWIPSFFPGFGRALLFDENFQPKPAYTSLRSVLERPE